MNANKLSCFIYTCTHTHTNIDIWPMPTIILLSKVFSTENALQAHMVSRTKCLQFITLDKVKVVVQCFNFHLA